MARAEVASASVSSDSIKGLAQSIAKPAYRRLLTAEPALRRAVPALIIAFLLTICVGAFVQILDHRRQAIIEILTQMEAGADVLAERIDRARGDQGISAGGSQPDPARLTPNWMRSPGRYLLVANADGIVFAGLRHEAVTNPEGVTVVAVPLDADMIGKPLLDILGPAQPLTTFGALAGVREMPLADETPAFATVRHLYTGQLAVIHLRTEALAVWRSDTALTVTLSATTGFVVLILGFAFHWQAPRAREGDLINDAVRGRIDTALNRGRCGLWDWDLSRGRIFWSQSMFSILGLDGRNELLTFGEVNALVNSDDIDLFAIADQLTAGEIDHIDQTFRMQHIDGHWIWLRVRCELSHDASD